MTNQTRASRCPVCRGSGKDEHGKPCRTCGGTGELHPKKVTQA